MPLNPANWPYGNVEEARLATGVKQARVVASNSADLPFFPKMILLTAASALTVTKLDGSTFVYNSGELAPNVWHPCVCSHIASNTVEILIQA